MRPEKSTAQRVAGLSHRLAIRCQRQESEEWVPLGEGGEATGMRHTGTSWALRSFSVSIWVVVTCMSTKV